MPELPEVETVVRSLEQQIAHLTIHDVMIHTPSIAYHQADLLANGLKGQQLKGFDRRGKYIVLHLTNKVLIIHLRMEGRFYINDSSKRMDHHDHIVCALDHNKYLHYHDTRKFGRWHLIKPQEVDQHFAHLGLEPFDPKLTASYLYKKTRNKTRGIKSFLLSQDVVTGIGNIYADEICFASKLHPDQPVTTISKAKYQKVVEAIQSIMAQAIADGGSSIRTYTDSLGISGRFQNHLAVHTRTNQPCIHCQQPIIKTKSANRGTYICQRCQKLK